MVPQLALRLLAIASAVQVSTATGSNVHERRCCRYSFQLDDYVCSSSTGCIVFSAKDRNSSVGDNNTGGIKELLHTNPSLEQCRVIEDSKVTTLKSKDTITDPEIPEKDTIHTDAEKAECLAKDFNGMDLRNSQVVYGIVYDLKDEHGQAVEYRPHSDDGTPGNREIPLPFSIHPYILSANHGNRIPAVEVRVAYDGGQWHDGESWHPKPSWNKLRFRLYNMDACQKVENQKVMNESTKEFPQACSPRCVTVERPTELEKNTESSEIRNGLVGS